ncbi:conserved hypothetical protein [Sporisorium reilianum SRZ2]|uniref:Reverse transcriptase domain-containing protein n=1 Tax=Sporisorium reilianum (strain SRZ2) TaxID=999809 RepID=E6ZRW9_SPORE|nr:conserved hypothetical protein [Sporisorium reilianum SRZ2]
MICEHGRESAHIKPSAILVPCADDTIRQRIEDVAAVTEAEVMPWQGEYETNLAQSAFRATPIAQLDTWATEPPHLQRAPAPDPGSSSVRPSLERFRYTSPPRRPTTPPGAKRPLSLTPNLLPTGRPLFTPTNLANPFPSTESDSESPRPYHFKRGRGHGADGYCESDSDEDGRPSRPNRNGNSTSRGRNRAAAPSRRLTNNFAHQLQHRKAKPLPLTRGDPSRGEPRANQRASSSRQPQHRARPQKGGKGTNDSQRTKHTRKLPTSKELELIFKANSTGYRYSPTKLDMLFDLEPARRLTREASKAAIGHRDAVWQSAIRYVSGNGDFYPWVGSIDDGFTEEAGEWTTENVLRSTRVHGDLREWQSLATRFSAHFKIRPMHAAVFRARTLVGTVGRRQKRDSEEELDADVQPDEAPLAAQIITMLIDHLRFPPSSTDPHALTRLRKMASHEWMILVVYRVIDVFGRIIGPSGLERAAKNRIIEEAGHDDVVRALAACFFENAFRPEFREARVNDGWIDKRWLLLWDVGTWAGLPTTNKKRAEDHEPAPDNPHHARWIHRRTQATAWIEEVRQWRSQQTVAPEAPPPAASPSRAPKLNPSEIVTVDLHPRKDPTFDGSEHDTPQRRVWQHETAAYWPDAANRAARSIAVSHRKPLDLPHAFTTVRKIEDEILALSLGSRGHTSPQLQGVNLRKVSTTLMPDHRELFTTYLEFSRESHLHAAYVTLPAWIGLLGVEAPVHGTMPGDAYESTPRIARRVNIHCSPDLPMGTIRDSLIKGGVTPTHVSCAVRSTEGALWEIVLQDPVLATVTVGTRTPLNYGGHLYPTVASPFSDDRLRPLVCRWCKKIGHDPEHCDLPRPEHARDTCGTCNWANRISRDCGERCETIELLTSFERDLVAGASKYATEDGMFSRKQLLWMRDYFEHQLTDATKGLMIWTELLEFEAARALLADEDIDMSYEETQLEVNATSHGTAAAPPPVPSITVTLAQQGASDVAGALEEVSRSILASDGDVESSPPNTAAVGSPPASTPPAAPGPQRRLRSCVAGAASSSAAPQPAARANRPLSTADDEPTSASSDSRRKRRLRVLQFNMGRSIKRLQEAIGIYEDTVGPLDVLILQEACLLHTWAAAGWSVAYSRTRPAKTAKQRQWRDAAVAVHPSITVSSLHGESLEASAGIFVHSGSDVNKCLFLSVYIRPDTPRQQYESHLLELSQRVGHPIPSRILVGGDFNVPIGRWSNVQSSDHARFGELAIEDFVGQLALELDTPRGLPTNVSTVRDRRTTSTTIDLTFSSTRVQVSALHLLENWVYSQHHPICFDFWQPGEEESASWQPRSPVQEWKRFDQSAFLKALDTALSTTASVNLDVDARWRYVQSAIESAAAACATPRQPGRPERRKQHAWWNEDCSVAERARTTALHAAQQSIRPQFASQDRADRRREVRRRARETPAVVAAQQHFELVMQKARDHFMEENINALASSQNWRKLGAMLTGTPVSHKANAIGPLRIADDSVSNEWADIESALLRQFFPAASRGASRSGRLEAHAAPPPFTLSEVADAIMAADSASSAGADKISHGLIKLCWRSNVFQSAALTLFRQCLAEGSIPKAWSEALISVIPKPGSDRDTRLAKNYRPISLLSCMGKILDKLLLNRLAYLTHSRLQPVHHGSLPMQDATIAVASLLQHAREWQNDGLAVCIATVDVSGAFNSLGHDRLLRQLELLGCGAYTSIISGWLRQRSVRLKFNGKVSPAAHATTTGVPQGSPLSPLLWVLFVDAFFASRSTHANVRDLAYVDDLTACTSGITKEVAELRAQRWLTQIDVWARNNGLGLDKPAFMRAGTGEDLGLPSSVGLTVGGACIPASPTIKMLGVIVDSNLTGESHLASNLAKAKTALDRLAGMTYQAQHGVSVRVRKRLVEAILWPTLDYGLAPLWPVSSATVSESIRRLDTNAGRFVFGMPFLGNWYGVSGPALLHELGWLPSVGRWTLQQQLTGARLLSYGNHSGTRMREALAGDEHRRIPTYRTSIIHAAASGTHGPFDFFARALRTALPRLGTVERIDIGTAAPWERFPLTVHIASNKEESIALHSSALSRHADAWVVYTDGSRSTSGVGAGAVVIRPGLEPQVIETPLSSDGFDIFEAELEAIGKGLNACIREYGSPPASRPSTILCFTDSCAALQRLTTSWSSDRRSGQRQALFISAACATLRRLGAEVQLRWVAGHHGVPGNERADLAARTAASAERTNEATLAEQVSISVVKARLAELAATQQRAAWDRSDGHSSLRAVQPVFNKGNGDRYLDLPVAVAQRLLQWRVGTALIRFHIGRVDACECGAVHPDRDHFLLHCPRTAAARAEFLAACGEPRLTATSILNSKTAIIERDRLFRAATASIRDDGAPAPSVASPSVTPHQSTSAASSLRQTAAADSTSRPQDSDATNGLVHPPAPSSSTITAPPRRSSRLQASLARLSPQAATQSSSDPVLTPRSESTSVPIGSAQPLAALAPTRAQPQTAPSLIPVRRTPSQVSGARTASDTQPSPPELPLHRRDGSPTPPTARPPRTPVAPWLQQRQQNLHWRHDLDDASSSRATSPPLAENRAKPAAFRQNVRA